jgi:hypothetical protein
MPRLTCPHCAQPLEAREEDRGERIECPHCVGALKVPGARPEAAAPRRSRIQEDFESHATDRPRTQGSSATGWIIGILTFVVFCIVFCCGVGYWWVTNKMQPLVEQAMKDAEKEMQRVQAEMKEKKGKAILVAAGQLAADYAANKDTADAKYLDKYLRITGVVERTGKDRDDTVFVALQGKDNVLIECSFDSAGEGQDERALKLKKGQMVTILGNCNGQRVNIELSDCELEN